MPKCKHGNQFLPGSSPWPTAPQTPFCRLCWNETRQSAPAPTIHPSAFTIRSLPCVSEGAVLSFCATCSGEQAELNHVRDCDLHETTTRGGACLSCPDYHADTGVVVGHYGLPKLARLQVAALGRFAGECPILLADDGSGWDAEFEAIADANPHVNFWPSAERRGHYAGDLAVFWKGLQWAKSRNLRYLCKVSQRLLWTREHWLRDAVAKLEKSGHATMMQSCIDSGQNLYVRSECMLFDVAKWLPLYAEFTPETLDNPTELKIWHLVHTHFGGAYCEWEGLTVDRNTASADTIWHTTHGADAYHGFAAGFGLELDAEFRVDGWQHVEGWKKG